MLKTFSVFKKPYINSLILISAMVIPFVMYLIYVKISAANIVYMDQIRMLNIVEQYFNGNLSLKELWSGYLEHRAIHYKLIFLANAILFNLNTLIEIYMGAIILLITLILIYIDYKKSLGFKMTTSNYIVFFLISCTIYSLHKWEIILLSMGLGMYLRILFFIFVFSVLNRVLYYEKVNFKIILALGFLTFFNINFFSGSYFFAAFMSMIAVLAFKAICIDKDGKRNSLILLITISISALLGCLLYFWDLDLTHSNNQSSIIYKVMFVLLNPLSSLKFYFLSLSSSVVGIETADKFLSQNVMVLIGTLLCIIYIYMIYLYISQKMYNQSYVPMLLILYTLCFLVLILVGRFNYGISYGMSSRYVLETQYGIIGVFWIISIYINRIDNKILAKNGILFLILLFLIFGQLITDYDEFKKGPYRKLVYEEMRKSVFNLTDANIGLFQSTPELTRKGLNILRKYNLNVFSDIYIGNSLEDGFLLYGWYPKEGNNRWISKEAEVVLKSGTKGELSISGYIPEIVNSNKISIYIDDNLVLSKNLKPGAFNFSSNVEKLKIYNIRITVEETFIPKNLGINNDKRILGIIIDELIIN